jgi:predicted  nucleic acid-binding Zn-ribbon protein
MSMKRLGFANIKSHLRNTVRSKPPPKNSEYLEMFVLDQTKARLNQEKEAHKRRIHRINKELSQITEEVQHLQAERIKKKADSGETKKYKQFSSIPIKAMPCDY